MVCSKQTHWPSDRVVYLLPYTLSSTQFVCDAIDSESYYLAVAHCFALP